MTAPAGESGPRRPELLAPAGNREKLETAVAFGADAVYFGADRFNLRRQADNFTPADIAVAVDFCRRHGVRAYLALNSFVRPDDLVAVAALLAALEAPLPDAFIVADPGVLRLCRERLPHVSLHLSTQANTTNHGAAAFWRDAGVRRINLARELSLADIDSIRRRVPDIELEVFVHGAMCMAVSGRCLLSAFLAGRDANRGDCAQPCRWRWAVAEAGRPGEFFPLVEAGDGSFIFNSRDLCLLEYLPALCAAGVDSLKIEGRMKSVHYLAVVVRTYRQALDMLFRGNESRDAAVNVAAGGADNGDFGAAGTPAGAGIPPPGETSAATPGGRTVPAAGASAAGFATGPDTGDAAGDRFPVAAPGPDAVRVPWAELKKQLTTISHRTYTSGFIAGGRPADTQRPDAGGYVRTRRFVALVRGVAVAVAAAPEPGGETGVQSVAAGGVRGSRDDRPLISPPDFGPSRPQLENRNGAGATGRRLRLDIAVRDRLATGDRLEVLNPRAAAAGFIVERLFDHHGHECQVLHPGLDGHAEGFPDAGTAPYPVRPAGGDGDTPGVPLPAGAGAPAAVPLPGEIPVTGADVPMVEPGALLRAAAVDSGE
ncbi:MAG: U32 family peptidase [Deltaproteobacteria bacterium]|nr:U32 family peptidase [Candidatus Anaeroferrophillacea bacterium]